LKSIPELKDKKAIQRTHRKSDLPVQFGIEGPRRSFGAEPKYPDQLNVEPLAYG
jgi:hypothetical protein